MLNSEIGSQPTMCQVHTGTYISLLVPENTDYIACHPENTTTYILHVYHLSLRIRTSDSVQLEKNKKKYSVKKIDGK